MRRSASPITAVAVVLAVVLALVLAGCGSSSSSNPVASSLSYFPKNSLFVMSLQTDPGSPAIKDMQALLRRFPAVTFGEAALTSKLQQVGLNYDTDIRPLFGNPVVIGITSPTSAGARSRFLVVWVTKDAGTLNGLLKKLHLPAGQTIDGAKVYSVSTASLAVDGATLVLGASPDAVTAALGRHAHGGGLTEGDQARAMGGLSQTSLISAFGDLSAVLASPSTAQARQVPWVRALRGYGVSISANTNGLTFQYRLDTSGAALTESQLPIAPGSTPPALAGSLPISAGATDPSRAVQFIYDAERITSPATYAAYVKRELAVRKRTGVDLNDLLKLLTGDAAVSSDSHVTMVRAQLSDAATGKQTLSKLATDPKAFSSGPETVSRAPGGFYLFKEATHTTTIGVVGDKLLVGVRATPAQLSSFASAPATPAAGAQGSVAFRVALPSLLQLALKQAPSATVKTLLATVGDLTGWLSASPSALTGSATVGIK